MSSPQLSKCHMRSVLQGPHNGYAQNVCAGSSAYIMYTKRLPVPFRQAWQEASHRTEERPLAKPRGVLGSWMQWKCLPRVRECALVHNVRMLARCMLQSSIHHLHQTSALQASLARGLPQPGSSPQAQESGLQLSPGGSLAAGCDRNICPEMRRAGLCTMPGC